jgi:lipoprotein-releasing system ATP-binding protein
MDETGMSEPGDALRLAGVVKTFHQAGDDLEILCGIDLSVAPGEIVALVGPSGSGKSTLLHIAGLLERPDGGEIFMADAPCSSLADGARTALRRKTVGFVYQFHHLLPEFSALENLILPQMMLGRGKGEARREAERLLDSVGLGPRADHRPARLSGGEQQRVALARALANRPKVLLADEPTGNLDPHTAEEVFEMLLTLVRGAGLAALIATHNAELAERMDRVLHLDEGRVV